MARQVSAAEEAMEKMKAGIRPSLDDKLKLIFDGYVERTCYERHQSRFHYRDPGTNELVSLKKDDFKEFLAADGFFDQAVEPARKKEGSKADKETAKSEKEACKKRNWGKLFHTIVRTRSVDWVGELGGIPFGLYVDNGYRCLIERGPVYPVPEDGDCSFIEEFMSLLLPGDQLHVFEAWITRAYQQKRDPDSPFICQIPILAGPIDCGKTLGIGQIIVPILGGRQADAIGYISGGTFNSELCRADVGVIDDQGFDTRFDLDVTTDRFKRWASGETKRVEKKFQPAINLHTKSALVVALNTESKNLRLLPDLSGDIRDKLLGFLCSKATNLPKGEQHEKAIQALIGAQRPAYLYKLLHKQNPPAGIISDGRFGVVPYFHPELLKLREDEDYAISILELIEGYLQINRLDSQHEWTSGELFQELTAPTSDRKIAMLSQCRNPKALGWHLSKLARTRPNSVIRGERNKHGASYRFINLAETKKRNETAAVSVTPR